jgi:hypothetical protein
VVAALGCFFGVGLAENADTKSLTQAYQTFATEVQAHQPGYQPETVTVDGWDSTAAAWQHLFPGIVIMRCFLHLVLGIQERCRSYTSLYKALTNDLWHLYHSLTPAQFGQRLRRLQEWVHATENIPPVVREKVDKLKALAPTLKLTFDYPQAYRTSNAVDQLMNFQDRMLYAMQYFHGSQASAQQALRAMALLWNFHPYCRKVQARSPGLTSPFEALNGFQYHQHWLRNLLIASSLNGRNTGKPVSLNSPEN